MSLDQRISPDTTPKRMRRSQRTEAASFVDDVKAQFEHDPRKYERFLDIMRDLKEDVIGPSEVIVQVAALFDGYPDLVQQFNTFLPPGYRLHPEGN